MIAAPILNDQFNIGSLSQKHDQIFNILKAMKIVHLHFCFPFEPQNKDLANVGHKIKGIIPVSNIES